MAQGSASVNAWSACATHSCPARVDNANWKGAVATSTTMSPAAMLGTTLMLFATLSCDPYVSRATRLLEFHLVPDACPLGKTTPCPQCCPKWVSHARRSCSTSRTLQVIRAQIVVQSEKILRMHQLWWHGLPRHLWASSQLIQNVLGPKCDGSTITKSTSELFRHASQRNPSGSCTV